MRKRLEVALILGAGVVVGFACATTATIGRTQSRPGVKVGVAGKAITIDVTSKDKMFVAVGKRRRSGGPNSVEGPLFHVLGPGQTRFCMPNMTGAIYVAEITPALVFENLNWNACAPQLCVDPGRLIDFRPELVNPRFRGEICKNGIDDDGDDLIDLQDPDCEC